MALQVIQERLDSRGNLDCPGTGATTDFLACTAFEVMMGYPEGTDSPVLWESLDVMDCPVNVAYQEPVILDCQGKRVNRATTGSRDRTAQ
jgi:hypothetical protein